MGGVVRIIIVASISFVSLMFKTLCSHSYVLSPIPFNRPYKPNNKLINKHHHRVYSYVTTSKRIFSSSSDNGILKDLNDSQRKAVTQPLDSIIRVVAGPGAGKTRVLTSRIAWLLQETLPGNQNQNGSNYSQRPYPPRVLAVTFTKKAAGEMRTRLDHLLTQIETLNECKKVTEDIAMKRVPQNVQIGTDNLDKDKDKGIPRGMERVTLGTFHSLCSKILRWYGEQLKHLPFAKGGNLDGSFTILDQADQLKIVKECMKKVGISSSKSDDKRQQQIKPNQILQCISNLKSNDIGVPPIEESGNENQSAAAKRLQTATRQIYPMYCNILLKNNAVDFDDLLLYTRDLITSNSTIQSELQRRWDFILVDEFQDTSIVQLDLVSKLVSKSLFVVGDQDQSIYSWRGASIEGMTDGMNEKFQEVRTLYLMENYRSTKNIVKAAQKVIGASNFNGNNYGSSDDTYRKKMIPMRGTGTLPRILACSDSDAEAEKIVTIIQEMLSDGHLSADQGSTVGILYRTNAQSRVIEEACVRKNIRYLVRGNVGTFYTRREIQDCLCFMKFLFNGRDLSSFLRCAKTPSRGIGNIAMKEFMEYSKSNDLSLLDALLSLTNESPEYKAETFLSNRALKSFRQFSAQFRTIFESKDDLKVGDLLSKVIYAFKLEAHFESICKTTEEFNDRMNNVNELRLAAERYSDDVGEFLDDVALLADIDVSDETTKGIGKRVQANLMTIHGAKGMEFDAVFIVGNEQGTFPSQRAILEGQDSVSLAEERRLCYVAMTRAKTNLCMTWRKRVDYFSGQGIATREGKRSQFLNLLLGKRNDSTSNAIKSLKVANVQPQIKTRSKQRFTNSFRSERRKENYSTVSSRNSKPHIVRNVNDLQKELRARKRQTEIDLAKRDRDFDTAAYLNRFDSTIFFSIGSKVSHIVHGKGTVVRSMNSQSSIDVVNVQFESGSTFSLPIQGSGLTLTRK